MFGLFYALYLSLLHGEWLGPISTQDAIYAAENSLSTFFNALGRTLQNMSVGTGNVTNNNSIIAIYTNVANETSLAWQTMDVVQISALVLALITSISVVVLAVKGIKHIFTIFFEGLR